MKTKKHESFYFGVYGIYIRGNKILMIKKARGPYKGTYDLPGGSIEYGEEIEDALKREFLEETNMKIKELKFLNFNMHFNKYIGSQGASLTMQHFGLYYIVNLFSGEIKKGADGEDSLGAEFIDINKLSEIKVAPIAKPMLIQALKNE